MSFLPDSNHWAFDEIRAVDSMRADRLENSSTVEQIVDGLLKTFEGALKEGKVLFGLESAEKAPEDSRVVLQFQIGEKLFDEFFNSRNGYRAHYWASGKTGTEFNYRIIKLFFELIDKSMGDEFSIRKLNTDYDDLGELRIAKSVLMRSLDSQLSKIWACTKKISVNNKSESLPLGVIGPKLIINSTIKWPGLYRDPQDMWLDVKGAFCGKNELYQVKTVEEREQPLHENGEA